ncbi:hypothetical protein [Streptomyces sp. NPDC059909]
MASRRRPGHDVREQADRAAAEPALLAELRASWERTDAGLLPYARDTYA